MSGVVLPSVVRGLLDGWSVAFITRDRDAFVSLMHEELELYLPRSAIEGTAYRGIEGAERAFADAFDSWERIEVVENWVAICAQDPWYLGKARPRMHPRGSGPPVEYDAYWLMRIVDGKIAYAHPYQDHEEALAAFAPSARG